MRSFMTIGLLLAITGAGLFGCGSESKDTPPKTLMSAPTEPPMGARGKGAIMPGDKESAEPKLKQPTAAQE